MATFDQIQKHYDKLTAPERFALMLKASGRGDNAERDVLANSAPKITIEFPHTKGIAAGFDFLTTWHLMQQLGAAGTFFMLIHWEDNGEVVSAQTPLGNEQTLGEAIVLTARRFMEGLLAWRAVCEEYQIDPETLTGMYPGYDHLLAMAELTIIQVYDNENPLDLSDLESTKEAYRQVIEHERGAWYEDRAK